MKIVQINIFPNLSTGNIMMDIHRKLLEEGHESYVVWGRGRKSNNEYEIFMNDKIGVYYHALYTRITDKTGFASKRATKKLLQKLEEIKPDIIHLHNIHGYYINIEELFDYIKNNKLVILKTIITTYIQFIAFYSVSYWVYRSFGLSGQNIVQITTIQSLLYATVSAIPSPGAVGVSEGGFLAIFASILPENMINSVMLLTRGVSFYLLIFVSMIITIINILIQKKLKNEKN